MRKLVIAACLVSVSCARGSGNADSTAGSPPDSVAQRDSAVVTGPPAAPVTQAPGATQAPSTPPTATKSSSPTTKTLPPPATGARADSVRGIVSVVGTSFEKRVMVAEQGTQRRVEVTGSLSSIIGHVAGAEVSVAGTMTGTRLEANRFLVRAVDGQQAIDGTLRTEGGVLYIVTAAGTRTRIVAPPPPLVGQDGARVWITGDPAKGVSSFGFIDPPR